METYSTKHAHVRKLGDVVVVKPHGNLMGGHETYDLEKLIQQLDDEGVRCLIVNLIDVGMMNSLALSRLIGAHHMFNKRDAKVYLCNLEKHIQNIFVVTKLSLVFSVFSDEESAIAAFNGDPRWR